ncbi:MAG: PH domain-containing protein [Methanomassiliicoccaceae archaeon]|nr:PH domain-containing protein [Methanomassiliicoccaceae archaeon]
MPHLNKISWVLIAAILVLAAMLVVVSIFGYDTELIYILLVVMTVLTVILLVIALMTRKTVAKLEYDGLDVRGALMHAKIPYGDIGSIEVRDRFDYGIRVGGYADLRRLGGKFRNKEFGTYDLSALITVKEYIVVHKIDGKVLVFNLETVEETLEFFEKLKKWTGK